MPRRARARCDKHVIIRVDRADGFVVHNLTARGALEHGIYVEETDGYRIDTVKMFWAADYGNLTFTSDHGLYTDCDGFGAGDAVLYPGAAPETGEQADLSFYPDAPRINTMVRRCDMRGSVLAYSGSMGNAVRHHATTTSTATPQASRPTRSRRAAIPATPPTAWRWTTTRSTRTTWTCSSRTRRWSRRWGSCPPASASSGPATTTAGFTTTGSGTTGATARCCSRSRISWSRPRAT